MNDIVKRQNRKLEELGEKKIEIDSTKEFDDAIQSIKNEGFGKHFSSKLCHSPLILHKMSDTK